MLSESCNVKVLAIYDICAVPLDSIKEKLDKDGDRAVGKVGNEYTYMHLGVAPGEVVPEESTMAQIVIDSLTKQSRLQGGVVTFPDAFVGIGSGLQPTLPTSSTKFSLPFKMDN